MAKIDIKAPSPGESITEVLIATWYKKNGDSVKKDEELVSLESDKAALSVQAESAGVLTILVQEGKTVKIGEVIGSIDPSGVAAALSTPSIPPLEPTADRAPTPVTDGILQSASSFLTEKPAPIESAPIFTSFSSEEFTRRPMSSLRKVIAKRLVAAKNETAMLTTFNEIDMSAVMDIRAREKERFEKENGVKLGFMSFFVKAVISALKAFPDINSYIEDTDIVTPKGFNIGVAVSTDKGLVVPVLKDAESLSFAGIEKAISDFGVKGKLGKITAADMRGGTFTITNGGTFGSLLSTPILNPPESGILGMHAIKKRPIEVKGLVEIRPMMYVALSYDHRIVDGKEAVSFLVHIKDRLENPDHFLLYT